MNRHIEKPLTPSVGEDVAAVDRPGNFLEDYLQTSRYLELRRIACHWHNGTVVLTGQVTTFYLKQVAQTLIRGIHGVTHIDNRIIVTTAAEFHLPSGEPPEQ